MKVPGSDLSTLMKIILGKRRLSKLLLMNIINDLKLNWSI